VYGSVSSGDKPNSAAVSLRLIGLPLLPLKVAGPSVALLGLTGGLNTVVDQVAASVRSTHRFSQHFVARFLWHIYRR
jgi:hypothetical protein